jgi:hypothetical protein
VTLVRQPPLTGSSDGTTGSNDTTAGSAASSAGSSSSSSASDGLGSVNVTDAAAAGVFSASARNGVTSEGVLSGVERYTVSLKPQPLVSNHD